MSATLHELEQELEMEAAHEAHEAHEMHHESHHEAHEQEQFFGALARVAAQAGRSPALQNIASQAARSALSLLSESESEYESEYELEGEYELESELNPVRKVYTDAMMEHMAHMASEAETEDEAAEAFLPLIPMVAAKLAPFALKGLTKVGAKLLPKMFGKVMKVAPRLTKGLGKVARTLFRNRKTRPLLRTLPKVGRLTVAQLAKRAARGQAVTPRVAVRTLAQQTARVLGSPHRCVHAYRRSKALDRQHHRLQGGGTGACAHCGRNGGRASNGHNLSHGNGHGAACVRCC